MDMIGKILGGRYEIIEKIGEGGMAEVYKAKCHLLNRYVAVKILKPEYAKDETFVKRFRREAQSAAALTHANIVSVYDVGAEGDINYIVMELLESKTLKDYIEEHGAMPSDLVLKISAQIASALETAHKAHIIHRDIKPQNIVLNKNMVAKVTDFGIAKITNVPSATITSFGSTMGSVHYFSPEHAKGGYTDEKSDIYSLGVVMYEMATGKLPFDADSPVSVALKQIQEDPIPPIDVNPNVSPALNQIILKALQKSTALRYQNATEVISDISQALLRPNSLILRPASSVEAGATQVIPILGNNEVPEAVPNLRTREPRRANVISTREAMKEELPIEDSKSDEEISEEPKKKDPKKSKKKKIIIISVIAAVVVIGAIVGILVYNNSKKQAEENKEIEVPNLVGRVYDEVVEEYSKQGIEIIKDKVEYSSEQPEGSVISQTPEKGTKTKDKKIKVVVSKGQKMVEVPDVTGKDIKVATYELEDTLGFKIEREDVVSEKVASGIIISQDAKKGETLPYGSTIKLQVSKGDGKETVVVPNVLGKTESDAKSALEALGLTVSVKYSEDKTKSNGVVIAQSYPQNQTLKQGTLVEITVNKILLTKTVTLDLLELQGGTASSADTINVKVTASIDGGAYNTVYNQSVDPSTKTVSVEINGYSNATLKVYLNSKQVKEFTVSFN
ncbi:MAG: Stk1 family PASTA domain-containing Ser/Thr kinase [Clostridia bacterium]|nr:Stk1 family PASTA domain-containing Ser/Thr kinase [Clostridia bacterium]